MVNLRKNENKELSAYSRELIDDTQGLSVGLFPDEGSLGSEESKNALAINKELFRTCALAVLDEMAPAERKDFTARHGGLKDILLLALEKYQSPAESHALIKERIDSLNAEDLARQIPVTDKLDLWNLDSDVCQMAEALYESFQDNPEVSAAHAYLNLTEN